MTPATMKGSGSKESSRTPLPLASRQAILTFLSGATVLFPETSHCPGGTTATPILTTASPTDRATTSPYRFPALSSDDGNFREIKAANHEKNATENKFARPSGSSQDDANGANDKHKKSVRFQSDVTLCGPNDTPQASDASSEEKQMRWYGAADFGRFKRDAAADAGVRIVRFCKRETAQESHHFVMVGDFDGRFDGLGTKNGDTGVLTGTASKKAYYNENEYSDSRNDGTGEFACRRGLGYHFSRARRKSRAVTQSAVLAWQRSLLAGAAPEVGDPGAAERTRQTLALVAARCSRTAREEAKWRGAVDYRVAHPERHADVPAGQNNNGDSAGSTTRNGATACRKRQHDVGDGVDSRRNGGRCKRRRFRSGGCRNIVGGGFPPAPVRMLRAEV